MSTHDIVILMGIGWLLPLSLAALIGLLTNTFK